CASPVIGILAINRKEILVEAAKPFERQSIERKASVLRRFPALLALMPAASHDKEGVLALVGSVGEAGQIPGAKNQILVDNQDDLPTLGKPGQNAFVPALRQTAIVPIVEELNIWPLSELFKLMLFASEARMRKDQE